MPSKNASLPKQEAKKTTKQAPEPSAEPRDFEVESSSESSGEIYDRTTTKKVAQKGKEAEQSKSNKVVPKES